MIEILTPCRDHVGRGGEQCAHECSEPNNAEWNEFLGGYFHTVQLLTPQERTARAHAAAQAEEARERIRAKTREYERTVGGFAHFNATSSAEARGIYNIVEQMLVTSFPVEPSDPETTIPPELNP